MFEELILQVASVVVMATLTYGANLLRQKTGIDIDARHRETLHSALLTGAKLAVARGLTGTAAIELIKQVARQGANDALKRFDLERHVKTFDDLAESKLEELLGFHVELPIEELLSRDRLTEELEKILGDLDQHPEG